MIHIKKLYKKYGKRKIQVYDDNKLLGEIGEFWNWISISNEKNHEILRKIAIENLWWLLHSDYINEDYTEYDAWKEKCDNWKKGKWYNIAIDNEKEYSNFFPGEYEIALNSINNR